MVAKSLRWALAGLIAFPTAALALGLGDIHLKSTLDAPLDANIEILGATPDQMANLEPRIASRSAFAQHGLDWSPFLADVTVRAVHLASGENVIEVRSTQPVTEPFLTLLVELDWQRGEFIREYDVLLDPPVYTPNHGEVAQSIAGAVAGPGARQGVIPRATPAGAPAPTAGAAEAAASSAATSSGATSPGEASPGAASSGAASSAATAASGGSASGTTASSGGASPATYDVHRGDTLSGIAEQFANTGRVGERRWMLAAYEANPSAFDHNMNWLRAGAVLRMPSSSAVEAITAAAATAEVHRQYVAWRGEVARTASPAEQPGRLRLVAPSQAGSGTGSASTTGAGAGAAGQGVQALEGQVQSLKSELAQSRRLVALKDAQLAQLQAKLATREGKAPSAETSATAASATGATAAGAAATPAAGAAAASSAAAAASSESAPAPATTPAEAPAATAVASAAHRPAAHRTSRRPATVIHRRVASPVSSLLDAVRQFWWVIALAILALLGYFGFRGLASRRKSGFDDSLGRLTEAGETPRGAREPVITEPSVAATARRETAREGMRESARESTIVVEESGSHERPALDGAALSALAARHVEADDTVSGEGAINLDQGDPLAEADFHMAYGLYDQAADLIRIAIKREPQRRELNLKLLEVFFVWGNKEQFLQTARELAASRAESAPGEWDKIVIMGKQLAPEDPLFAGGSGVSGAAAGGVDLDLEGGQHRVDFDLAEAPAAPADQGVDLDIGTAIGERDPIAEAAAHQATDKNLALDDSLVLREDSTAEREIVTATRRMTGMADGGGTREMTGSTREMAARTVEMAASTREMTTTLEQDSWNPAELSQEPEAPTVERPVLQSSDHPPLRQKVEMALKAGAGDHTAELALDDLGLDLDGLQGGALENAEPAPQEGADTGLSAAADALMAADARAAADSHAAADAPTLVAGLDERSRRLMETAEQRALSPRDGLKVSETGTWHFDEDPFASESGAAEGARAEAPDLIDTSRLTALKSGTVDFEVDEPRPAQTRRSNGSGGLDLDVGAPHETEAGFAATQRLQSSDLALPDLDPVTMSEVGTKLDLARAYMDMGDPEGARNILEEVLTEGSAAQKQEAERLIASLPG